MTARACTRPRSMPVCCPDMAAGVKALQLLHGFASSVYSQPPLMCIKAPSSPLLPYCFHCTASHSREHPGVALALPAIIVTKSSPAHLLPHSTPLVSDLCMFLQPRGDIQDHQCLACSLPALSPNLAWSFPVVFRLSPLFPFILHQALPTGPNSL